MVFKKKAHHIWSCIYSEAPQTTYLLIILIDRIVFAFCHFIAILLFHDQFTPLYICYNWSRLTIIYISKIVVCYRRLFGCQLKWELSTFKFFPLLKIVWTQLTGMPLWNLTMAELLVVQIVSYEHHLSPPPEFPVAAQQKCPHLAAQRWPEILFACAIAPAPVASDPKSVTSVLLSSSSSLPESKDWRLRNLGFRVMPLMGWPLQPLVAPCSITDSTLGGLRGQTPSTERETSEWDGGY